MTTRSQPISRRAVLRGAGGVVLGLPALDILTERTAFAAGTGGDFAVFIINDNGVQQAHGPSITGAPGNEPERFWPTVVDDLALEFSTPWDRVFDDSRGPEWTEWFVGEPSCYTLLPSRWCPGSR